ncbi:U3 snoRNP protein [Conoideocrella luteorostrata]|uniref:U3 snoRNP protein n=1 Tax=Conoideocrella luteorostrata TaxID=1105319 RepID=A0AAJ0CTA7_9HYPO|nr:U3 snoRNP protein [Conoideocrella luteorostrata]
MPSRSSGRIEKVRKNKYSTPHQKNHRWESFSTKIAKFNSLQPLRKVRRHDLDNEDLSTATSYFQIGLQKWSELNISKPFTFFKRDVLPLSESLPQLLHFEDRIMACFVQYISLQDKDALEPLLDLMTAFAHDLGARFEKFYLQGINLLLAIAGKPQDVEVIEWTFGAMAFLFKYLSKLLVPDLRPTYDLMASVLGRSRHPQHIARFAAEAMSFLVKKAAAPSYREIALKPFIEHVRNDLINTVEDRQFSLYNDGLMTMFAEAIKGTDNAVHSTGGAIISALIDSIPENECDLARETIWTDAICGILTSVVHHGTADTMADILEEITGKIRIKADDVLSGKTSWKTVPYIRILGVLAGVRRGSRIGNWDGFVRAFVDVLRITGKGTQEVRQDQADILWGSVMVNIAIVGNHAPMDTLIPHISTLTQTLTKEPFMRWFISFCAYFCDLNTSRFGSLFRSEFQKFVAAHWSQGQNEDVLCMLLPRMIRNRAFPPLGEKDCTRLPQAWQDQIVSKFERLEISPFPERGPYNKDPQEWRDRCLPKYAGLLQLLELTSVHPSTNARIAELLSRKLKLALRPSSSLATDEVNFIVSQGFHAYLRMSKAAGSVDTSLSPLLRAAVPRFARSVGFLEAYLAYERTQKVVMPADEISDKTGCGSPISEEDPVITSLVENLSSPSHDIRLVSLELLKQINDVEKTTECVDVMLQVEQTPLTHEHTRTIAMHLRKIGQYYNTIDSSTWLKNGVPRFMFGMLTVKLSPVWDDAVENLKYLTQSKTGEEAVSNIVFQWIQNPSLRWTPPTSEGAGGVRRIYTDFECTAKRRLEDSADIILDLTEKADDALLKEFDARQHLAESIPTTARSRGLKVLNAIPSVAEKRSRQLVPHFLCWAIEDDGDASSSSADETLQFQASTWSLADRKAILGIFAQFANPKVLFQHEKVYEALLLLMENGDGDVQNLALKAILTWKQDGVYTYRENLEYLLDEARFRNELVVFLQGDNVIKSEHRPELMPVLLRLLYGRTIAKKGIASGRNGLLATRLAVLRNLSVQDMGSFLEIAAKKLKDIQVIAPKAQQKKLFSEPILTPRKQVGFLNMISSLIAELGTNVEPYMNILVNSVLYCLVFSSIQLRGTPSDNETKDEEGIEKAGDWSLLKQTRSLGIKCLTALFQNEQSFQWDPYKELIIEEAIAPRLENLPAETTQGISAMLHLLSTWSALPKAALFLAPLDNVLPQGVLPKLIDCISMEKTKDEVKIFVLNILQNLVKLTLAPADESEFNEVIKAELLQANASAILSKISAVLHMSNISNDLLESCIETVLALAPVLLDLNSSQTVIRMCSFLLQQPPRRVSPRAKGRILLILERFVGLPDAAKDQSLLHEVYDTLSSLFSYFKDRGNRQSLSRAMLAISQQDADIAEIASLCNELNTFKEGRIDEPDYDRRLAAFNIISTTRKVPFTPKQWLPIIHNLIYSIRMDEEFGVLSSNSADGMRRMVQNAADCKSDALKTSFDTLMRTVLMPSIYSGAKEPSETVRREYLRVMGFLITVMPDWEPIVDLSGLLTERNEDTSEPSFFFNILSPATARQLEALRALEAANGMRQMSSRNLGQFFIPLLEHFIYGRTDGSDDHGLGANATTTISNLALSLNWNHYRTTLYRYISYIESRTEMQKQTVRLLSKFVDAAVLSSNRNKFDVMDVDEDEGSSTSQRLQQTVPKQAKLSVDVLDYILPPLVKHLHEKDESEVSYRVPVGVVIVKLLKLLPAEQMDQKLAGVLTDICHILRSRSWEAREMARDTLVKIAEVLGSSFFGFILKELRGALTRGYQLHVLSYTMHSILVATVPTFAPGDLDHCLPAIVTVIMDDIFGAIGQEKDADGYVTQMKEIKSSKSQDSMELVAKNASVTHLISLVKPLQALLLQKVDLKLVRKIDALMARIGAGLLQNPAAESRDTLVFCYEIIQETYRSQKPEAVQKMDPRVRKYLVQKGAKKSGERGRTEKHTYKMLRFAFDILRSMFKKHDDLRTPVNVTGFLPIIGDAIVGGEDEVKISAFRLLAVLIKVPFDSEDGNNLYKVAVKEATRSISQSTSTTTEISQAALKLLAVLLRERKDVAVKDAAIDMLLGKLKDDFTEPLYRHVTFNFLRSVMDRRVETAAVYDILDHVGTVMVTNDDKDTRDLARGAFFQFIREYPQKKARWSKQLNFVVANLKYDREGGRLSVMEVIHLLLMKSSIEFVQEVIGTCFLPLFFVLANDDSEKCRLSAGELMKEVFHKADKERTQQFLVLLRTWLNKDDNATLQRLGLQTFGYYFESRDDAHNNNKDCKLVLKKSATILKDQDINDADSQLIETTLNVLRLFAVTLREETLSGNKKELWADAGRYLRHSQPSVKLSAVRLINSYLADFAKQRTKAFAGEAIEGSHGLTLDLEAMHDFTRLALGSLNSNEIDETLAAELVQVIVFLGTCLPVSAVGADDEEEVDEHDEDAAAQGRRQGVDYLFWRLSHILRREIPPRLSAINSKVAAMEILETVCRRIFNTPSRPSLKTVLVPLQQLTDPSIPPPFSNDELFKTKLEGVKTRAQIMMDSLQKKFGTAEYSKVLVEIRDEVKARRQQRNSKRKIEAITQPEKYGRDKRKKFEKNKERRKERSKEQKVARQSYKGW